MEKIVKLIFRKVRDANLNYRLIENGDRVAVAMSGGKDSMALLYFLHLLKKYTPLQFDLCPIYLDLGWDNRIEPMIDYCAELGYPLLIESTYIGKVVFDICQEKSPCSLCANLRRGALNRTAKLQGCNKAALGHHLDDVVATLFLSIFYERRYRVFKPLTYLDRMDISLIRPLIYVEEKEIKRFITTMDLPTVKNRCPADGITKRAEVNRLMNLLEEEHPGARQKILSSLERVGPDTFWID